jgi:hypothetical protein
MNSDYNKNHHQVSIGKHMQLNEDSNQQHGHTAVHTGTVAQESIPIVQFRNQVYH